MRILSLPVIFDLGDRPLVAVEGDGLHDEVEGLLLGLATRAVSKVNKAKRNPVTSLTFRLFGNEPCGRGGLCIRPEPFLYGTQFENGRKTETEVNYRIIFFRISEIICNRRFIHTFYSVFKHLIVLKGEN